MNEKTITILNRIEQIEEIASALEILSVEWNIPMNIMLSMNLVLEELVTNVIFYGYNDKAEHKIIIGFSFDGNIFQMKIEDDAIEFDPLQAADPNIDESIENRKIGGLGIYFVKQFTDSIKYERIENKNILRLSKNIM